MTTRKRLEGALADWHPHPKDNESLAPVVRDPGVRDEIADRFFDSAPELHTPEPPVAVEPGPRRVAIDSAAVRARRRYLMRYVAGAVSLAGVIGHAASVRVTLARDASAANAPSHATSVALSLPAPASEPAPAAADPILAANSTAPAAVGDSPLAANLPVAPDPQPAANPVSADRPAPMDPAVAAGAWAAADPPGVAAVPVAADPPSASTASPPSASGAAPDNPLPDLQAVAEAKQARSESQRALDRGHLAESIEAGEQAIALDPTDADAWLILGAAYQKQGHTTEARRCFASCAKEARRGPRWECGALLR